MSRANYGGPRKTLPKTLVEKYAAITESFVYPFPTTQNRYIVQNSNVDMNQLQAFEPIHSLSNYLTNSPLASACYSNFDEFRIRCVKVELIPNVYNPTTVSRTECYVWWCPNHYEEDQEVATGQPLGFLSFPELKESDHVTCVAHGPGQTISFTCVPQVYDVDSIGVNTTTFVQRIKDKQSPWMKTSTDFVNALMRMPIIQFRRPYSTDVQVYEYDVVLTACIEFRNIDAGN